MNADELRQQMLGWLRELKTWYSSSQQKWEDYIEGEDCSPDEHRIIVIFYTDQHRYSISGSTRNYLGCMAQTRKPRAGEDHTRGNDLPDGKFCRETWDAIIRAIVGYELVAKTKPQKPIPCESIEK